MPLEPQFRYRPACCWAGCEAPALFKIAATWSGGSSRELKNYGLACEEHRDPLFAAARRNRDRLKLAEDESVGPLELYLLRAGYRDAELVPLRPEAGQSKPDSGPDATAQTPAPAGEPGRQENTITP
jgi:hypothetical protein